MTTQKETHSKFRNQGVSPPILTAVPVVLTLGLILLAVSCASANMIIEYGTDFVGRLDYDEEYQFVVGFDEMISPKFTPSVLSADENDVQIRYVLKKVGGVMFFPEPTIDSGSGIIAIKPIANAGIASYVIQASAVDYNTQEIILTIIIDEAERMLVSAYHSMATNVFPIELGQAIEDDGSFSLTDDDVVITVAGFMNGVHRIHFGTTAGTYDKDYQKLIRGGTTQISKSDLKKNSFSFMDGAVIGISGPGITDILHIATYYPSNIHNHQDLQAMRKNLSQDYTLKKNIVFLNRIANNYKTVGDGNTMFTGSLDGAGYSITGIQIEDNGRNQGLFGVMEGREADTIIAQNLMLIDFKIKGRAVVGSLAGWVRRGTVVDVHVKVSSENSGKIEVSDAVEIDESFYGLGGGLLGLAGTGTTNVQVRIRDTSSEVVVTGLETSSGYIGGLVGHVESDVVLTESFATGSVRGHKESIGGLVGYNSMGIVSGYATGSVLGLGSNEVGGLVGRSNMGMVTGYATGSVVGRDEVGGLVGYNSEGTVTGYATGSVLGVDGVGGLVGHNSMGTVIGYAKGLSIGLDETGGLVGSSDGIVIGYARNIVRQNDGEGKKTDFGKVIGSDKGTSITYSSMSESRVYEGITGTTALADMSGVNGTPVTVDGTTAQAVFADFVFAPERDAENNLGPWTWVADGKWPAINIGDEIKPASEQPIDLIDP